MIQPVVGLLRSGVTPTELAWALALGVVIGVNPLLGSTTLAALLAAVVFRANVVATQVSNHVVYPLELLMFPFFIRLGALLFRTGGLPLGLKALFAQARTHPWDLTKLLWRWEWHALVVWAAFACLAAPVLAAGLRPILERALFRAGLWTGESASE